MTYSTVRKSNEPRSHSSLLDARRSSSQLNPGVF
jgi:hypothetical protein